MPACKKRSRMTRRFSRSSAGFGWRLSVGGSSQVSSDVSVEISVKAVSQGVTQALITDVTQGSRNPPRSKLRPSRNGRVCGSAVAGFYLLDKAPKQQAELHSYHRLTLPFREGRSLLRGGFRKPCVLWTLGTSEPRISDPWFLVRVKLASNPATPESCDSAVTQV